METRKRSILKALSWRLVAVCITAATAYAFTNKMTVAAGVAVADSLIKVFVYYGHERLWNRLSLGKEKPAQPDRAV